MSATRPSSRASSRSGCTSGMMELESNGSRRTSRRGVQVSASRAGAARAAAILLISRHLKAVKRDGGAHPPKCAAKGEMDNVCNARSHSARLGVRATTTCQASCSNTLLLLYKSLYFFSYNRQTILPSNLVMLCLLYFT